MVLFWSGMVIRMSGLFGTLGRHSGVKKGTLDWPQEIPVVSAAMLFTQMFEKYNNKTIKCSDHNMIIFA
jgi:hypothetical protein